MTQQTAPSRLLGRSEDRPVDCAVDAGPRPAVVIDRPDEPTTRQRVIGVALEFATALAVMTAFLLWCARINVNPLLRTGQVSGLAKVDLRFAALGLAVIGALLLAERFAAAAGRRYARQAACAALAALASSIVAGGIIVALHGTPWSIFAGAGDYSWIKIWMESLQRGDGLPAGHYPPLPIYLLYAAVEITGQEHGIVLKPLQIVGTALFGPVAYFSWRLLLKPLPALAIGVVSALTFIESLKVYPQLILVATLPVVIKFVWLARRAHRLTRGSAIWSGMAFGAGFALLFMSYSGHFVWAGPGVVGSLLVLVPWRRALARAALFLGTTAVVFLPLTWVHLSALLADSGAINDDFQYFDTRTEPGYIAMWRNDLGGDVGSAWPPLGELANVGVFTVLLIAGVTLALVLGWRRTPVVVCCGIAAGAFVMRFVLAGLMHQSGMVRLYPRTTMVIMYCFLALTGFGLYYAVERIRGVYRHLDGARPGQATDPVGPAERFRATVPVGVLLAPLLLLFGFAGSASADRWMPADRGSTAQFYTWISHAKPLPDGACTRYWRDACVPRR